MMNLYYVTGTSSGIGHAFVKELLKNERNLIVGMGRSCNISHTHYKHIKIDLSKLNDINGIEFEEAAVHDVSKIILFNNSAQVKPVKYLGNLENQDIIQSFNLNLIAPILLMNNFIKKTKKLEIEKVVMNVSSGAAQTAVDGWSLYCSSKSGINMVSEVSNIESEKSGLNLKVFAVAPGVVDTKMQDEIRNSDQDDFSRLEEFKNYKENEVLRSPEWVAKKYIEIIENSHIQKEVIFRI